MDVMYVTQLTQSLVATRDACTACGRSICDTAMPARNHNTVSLCAVLALDLAERPGLASGDVLPVRGERNLPFAQHPVSLVCDALTQSNLL